MEFLISFRSLRERVGSLLKLPGPEVDPAFDLLKLFILLGILDGLGILRGKGSDIEGHCSTTTNCFCDPEYVADGILVLEV